MRVRGRDVLVCGALVLWPLTLTGQTGAIEGTVREESGGGAVPAAWIRVVGPEEAVTASGTTNRSGEFLLTGVPVGTFTVRIQALGYEPFEVVGVVVSDERTALVLAELTPRAFDLDPLIVTASRTEERRLDSPAAVEVVQPLDVRERSAVTLADHVTGLAGVDVIRTGLQGNYVTVRGFNNIFSGATLTLTDYRIASVPSLRANVHHMNAVTNADIERVEVVLGPGSALYGPNAAHGVIHSITSSPLDFPGGTLSVASGLRQQAGETAPSDMAEAGAGFSASSEPVIHVEGRYAARIGEQVGIKLSAQHFQGEEWRFDDPVEVRQRALAGACREAEFRLDVDACLNFSEGLNLERPGDVELLRTSVDNVFGGRDDGIRRYSFDLRADWRPREDVNLIFAGGRTTNVSSVDLTGLGAAQVVDWNSEYVQLRGARGGAFGQFFLNRSDNTESYLLRSGRPLHDRSHLLVAQFQNEGAIGDRHTLVYGADLLRTVPRTRGTINGRNEDDDDITEVGGYAQSESRLSERVSLVLAARLDDHTRLEDPVFSPRAGLVFAPTDGQNFRFTYNRAFSTPTTLNLFLDISGGTVPLGGPFRYDVRAQGVTESGLRFQRTEGVPDHMSPFALLLGRGARDFQPTTTERLWETAVAVVQANDPATGAFLASLPVPSASQVGIDLRLLNPEAGEDENPFRAAPFGLAEVGDIPPLRPTITNSLEVGYRGLVVDRLLLAFNVYHSRIHDYTSALRVNSPNVFLNRADLEGYLQGLGVPGPQAAALATQIGGEGEHGSAAVPGIPLGVITPVEAGGTDPAIVLTYENLGDVNLWGSDLSLTLLIGGGWELTGNAAWVSDEQFITQGQVVPLNAPTLKGSASVRYRNQSDGMNGQLRARHAGSFPANSAVYVGEVGSHTVFDLTLGYRLPQFPGLTAQLDVQNLFDSSYRTFVGTPQLGRLALVRLRFDF